MDVHHVVKAPADLGVRNLDAPLRIHKEDGIRRKRDMLPLVRTDFVAKDPDVLAHLGHNAHRDTAPDSQVGDLHIAAVHERHHRPRAPATQQQAQRLIQRKRALPGVFRMGILDVAEKHLPIPPILRRNGVKRGGERILVAFAGGCQDVLDVAVTKRVNGDLALTRVRAALIHVEENLAVLCLVWRAPFDELTEETLVVLLRDRELHEREAEDTRGEVADRHAVTPLHHKGERIAVEDKTGTAAIDAHILQSLQMHDHLLHARGTADGGEEVFLRPLLEKVVLPLGEAKRVAVLKTHHRRAHRRRGVPLDRCHLDNCSPSRNGGKRRCENRYTHLAHHRLLSLL